MKFYMEIKTETFPHNITFGRPHDFVEVETTEEVYDHDTQLPGRWSTPILRNGVWTATRGMIDKTQELMDAEDSDDLKNLRSRRNAYLAQTDGMLSEDYPITSSKRNELKEHRKSLRDITDPVKSGEKKAREIVIARFDNG